MNSKKGNLKLIKTEVRLSERMLKECIQIIKDDPSGIELTRLLAALHNKNIINKTEKDFYFFEAERRAYGFNMTYYKIH